MNILLFYILKGILDMWLNLGFWDEEAILGCSGKPMYFRGLCKDGGGSESVVRDKMMEGDGVIWSGHEPRNSRVSRSWKRK